MCLNALGVCKPELTSRRHGGILVFWESWRNLVVNSEEMKLCKILGINVKLKNDKFKFSPIKEKKRCCNVTNVKYDRHGRFPRHISSSLLMQNESNHFLKFFSPVSREDNWLVPGTSHTRPCFRVSSFFPLIKTWFISILIGAVYDSLCPSLCTWWGSKCKAEENYPICRHQNFKVWPGCINK